MLELFIAAVTSGSLKEFNRQLKKRDETSGILSLSNHMMDSQSLMKNLFTPISVSVG